MNRLNTENINGLVSIYADNLQTALFDADTSGNIYGTSLYINNQLINFGAYVTSSYLASNYALISSLSNYVLSSTLSSTLNNYATTSALSSYRLISDSFNKSDVTNEVVIRTGYSGLNSDGSIKTCKQYTDENIAGVSAVTATNSGAIAGLVASLATTNATIAIIEGEVATIQGELTTIDGQITTLQGKTQNQTATAGNTNFAGVLNVTNGVNNNITLNQTGDITCLTETLNTLTCNTELKGNGKLNFINQAQNHVLDGASITLSHTGATTNCYGNLNVGQTLSSPTISCANINQSSQNIAITNSNFLGVISLSSFQINIDGLVYINGKMVVPFSTGPAGGQWSFLNT
jgi:hypothetical protein